MKEIKTEATPWKKIKTENRGEEVVISRLYAGHCLLSHGYLIDDSVPHILPICEACDNSVLTVKHIMGESPQYDRCRRRMSVFQKYPTATMNELLGDKMQVEIFEFLRSTGLYDKI